MTVSQSSATTHAYRAYVSPLSFVFPPLGIVATSATSYVTWTASGYQLTLTAPASTSFTETVTAAASIDVGPTPYFIEIFDEDTGARLLLCGLGTFCSIPSFHPSLQGDHLVAFISASDTTLPPANIQASSNTVLTTLVPIIT